MLVTSFLIAFTFLGAAAARAIPSADVNTAVTDGQVNKGNHTATMSGNPSCPSAFPTGTSVPATQSNVRSHFALSRMGAEPTSAQLFYPTTASGGPEPTGSPSLYLGPPSVVSDRPIPSVESNALPLPSDAVLGSASGNYSYPPAQPTLISQPHRSGFPSGASESTTICQASLAPTFAVPLSFPATFAATGRVFPLICPSPTPTTSAA